MDRPVAAVVGGADSALPAAHRVGPAPGGDGESRDEEVLTGRRVGRYRVGPVVHRGPMSTLYRADEVRLDRPVALKVISPLLAGDPEFRDRFVEEARSLSAVDHPHVVPLYDFDEEPDGHLWLAMRWVDGSSLAQTVAGQPMALSQCLAVFEQVAAALDAVHACGLVHLDVKPANILLTTDPGEAARPHVYLADFGLTRRGRSGGRTTAGQVVASPAFAAPEHLRGEPVTPASDVYALGCAVHTAVTGRPPYRGSVDDVIAGHLGGRLYPASQARAEVLAGPEPHNHENRESHSTPQSEPSRPADRALDGQSRRLPGSEPEHGRDADSGLGLGGAVDAELARALAPDPADRHAGASTLVSALRVAMHHDHHHDQLLGTRPRPTTAPGTSSAAPVLPGLPVSGPVTGPAPTSPPSVGPRPAAPSSPGPPPGPPLGPPLGPRVSVPRPGGGSVHGGASLRRVRPPATPLTEDVFSRAPWARSPRGPRPRAVAAAAAVLVVAAVLAGLLVLVLA